MVAIPCYVPRKTSWISKQESAQSSPGGRRAAGDLVDVGTASQAIAEVHFARAMRVAGNTLLLRSADVSAPTNAVVAQCLDPVVDPLKMVLRFFQRAVALIHAQCVSEVKSCHATDIERWHSTGLRCTQIQSGEPGIRGRGCADPIRLDANAITIEAETEVRDEGWTQRVSSPECYALITIQRATGKIDTVQTRAAGLSTICSGSGESEVSESIASEEMPFLREGVIDSTIHLITIEMLASAGNEIIEKGSVACVRRRNVIQDIGDSGGNRNHVRLALRCNRFAASSVDISSRRIEDHTRSSRGRASFSRGHHYGGSAATSGRCGSIAADVVTQERG